VGAFVVQPESEEEPGKARDFPQVDLERCKQCGDCAKACTERAVKMV
jgi:formate hydrogenlyase subunit 6/NADH:ubiquinone oxidoreductase subunit I